MELFVIRLLFGHWTAFDKHHIECTTWAMLSMYSNKVMLQQSQRSALAQNSACRRYAAYLLMIRQRHPERQTTQDFSVVMLGRPALIGRQTQHHLPWWLALRNCPDRCFWKMCWPAFKFVLAVTVCPKFCATLLSKSTCKKQNALDPKEKKEWAIPLACLLIISWSNRCKSSILICGWEMQLDFADCACLVKID